MPHCVCSQNSIFVEISAFLASLLLLNSVDLNLVDCPQPLGISTCFPQLISPFSLLKWSNSVWKDSSEAKTNCSATLTKVMNVTKSIWNNRRQVDITKMQNFYMRKTSGGYAWLFVCFLSFTISLTLEWGDPPHSLTKLSWKSFCS